MSKFIHRLAAVAALALAATPIIGLTTAAHAAEPVRIQLGDLRLSSPSQAAEFISRVEAAANEACAPSTPAEKLRGLSVQACITDFNADVRAELTSAQRNDLKTARRAQPSTSATRSLGLF